jgi:hypothetical protein
MPTNDVVRQFAVDIERNRAALIQLQKACKRNTICNVVLGIGLAITGSELYLIEKESKKDDKKK